MGAGSSRNANYPFSGNGMPPHEPSQKSKKGKERAYQQYQQYPVVLPPTAYGVQYYPYMQPSGYPQVSTYYAPVAMVPIQQPMVSMPQPYVPVQNAAAAPVIPSANPAMAPRRMPEPTTNNNGPVIPNTTPANNHVVPPSVIPEFPNATTPSGPVIPPPPIITDTPRGGDPSSRPRFTNFYRPADPPVSMPEPQPVDIPYRPPTVPPARMSNPLPSPPRDIWETTPYRQVLRELPKEITLSLDVEQMEEVENMLAQPSGSSSRLGGLFGSSKRNGKSRKGLFRVFSTPGGESDSGRRHHRSNTVTSFVIPPAAAMPPGTSTYPGVVSPQHMPVPDRGPPIKFNHIGELSGFVNHSPHRVLYRNKMYPTAMHLLEAMKFTAHPDIQERIRKCKDVGDMYPLSGSFQQYVRPDWGQAFLKTMEDVLYLKFKQHPNLRTLLLNTGLSDLMYADDNVYWGEGPSGTGSNELGKALMRVRDKIRADG